MGKAKTVEIKITDIKFPNIGIGRTQGGSVAVKNALPGQRLLVRAGRSGRRMKGRVLEVLERADYEIKPPCDAFGICGGCAFLSLPYAKELKIKADMVRELLAAFVPDGAWGAPVPAPAELYYRNKMEFSFGDDGCEDGELTLGMRRRGSYYEAVNADDCLICHADFGAIVAFTREYFRARGHKFYHRRNMTGSLRHLVVRRGFFTGEILVNLVTAPIPENGDYDYADYADHLAALPLNGKIVSVLHTQNSSPADVVLPEQVNLLYGRDYIYDELLGLRFKISPFSFFQTNSAAAELLYGAVREFAGDVAGKTVFDLYCGCGTIAQVMSVGAANVIGIELVEEAVIAANENAAANGLNNCRFICGDVRHTVRDLSVKPDLIILDPPREGIHPKALVDIIGFDAPRMIYISCKASSFAKDLEVLTAAGYNVEQVRLHDLFPKTANVEVVALLVKDGMGNE